MYLRQSLFLFNKQYQKQSMSIDQERKFTGCKVFGVRKIYSIDPWRKLLLRIKIDSKQRSETDLRSKRLAFFCQHVAPQLRQPVVCNIEGRSSANTESEHGCRNDGNSTHLLRCSFCIITMNNRIPTQFRFNIPYRPTSRLQQHIMPSTNQSQPNTKSVNRGPNRRATLHTIRPYWRCRKKRCLK